MILLLLTVNTTAKQYPLGTKNVTLVTRIEVRIMRLRKEKGVLRCLRFRTKQVIKVMRAKDKGDKKTDSNKYK